ncbi:apolipoprotein D-like [Schistocerca americana]|uniref:apolipoprotein D-like n=1 Tax=Schistocerca americana TaxID=7009 RepID=UPI001F4F23D0|nr:apolipoprotein D-like [Schistocerca americana]XP_049799584.1 apolipoprotein D-like [Schistocerca nitens]XP_049940469.1 apolipoprotein D-like [Schistocerca serialis cubense]
MATTAAMCAPALALLLLLVLMDAPGAAAQRLGFGRCPSHRGMRDFDIKKFEGKWYEVERSFYLYEIISSCTSIYFSPKPSGNVKVAIKTVNRLTGSMSTSLGSANPLYEGSATLNYRVNTRLPSAVARMMPGVGLYTILHTDYDNYAILWSCSDLAVMHADLVWVLGRKKELPVEVRAQVYNKLVELGIDTERLTLSRQRNCPVF